MINPAPNTGERVCFGHDPGMHIGTCAEFSDDRGMCVDGPIDAASYSADVKLFCAVNMPPGTGAPNIKTHVNGNLVDTKSFPAGGRYCWVTYWQPGDIWNGRIRFEFCDGEEVIFSKTTRWYAPIPEEERIYVKFAIPYLDMIPGIPCEPWIWVMPGFKLTDLR